MNWFYLYIALSTANPDTSYSYDYATLLKHLEETKQEIQQEQIHTKLDSIIVKLKTKQNDTRSD